jgi:lambda family phage portal protein
MSPRHAAKRQNVSTEFAELKADYAAAKPSRFRRNRMGNAPLGSGADYHVRNDVDLYKLMEQARDYVRNDALAGSLVQRSVDNLIQSGFSIDPQTGDAGLDTAIYDRFTAWMNDPAQCDIAGELTFHDFLVRSTWDTIVDGGCAVLPTDSGALQYIEHHRIRTPKGKADGIAFGVEIDEFRRRIAYWIADESTDPTKATSADKMRRVPAWGNGFKNVFYLGNFQRVSQTRGVTAFAPIFDMLGLVEDINFAALVKQQVASCFAIFRQMEMGAIRPGGGTPETGPREIDRNNRLVQDLAPGMEIVGEPGETLQGFTPQIPGQSFLEHMRTTVMAIGNSLGLPLVVALMDAKETNFAGFRGALDQAKIHWRGKQRGIVSRLCSPAYEFKVRDFATDDPALARYLAANPQLALRHRWNPPVWPYTNPQQDVQTDLIRVRNGMASPRQIQSERGRDWEEVAAEIVADNAFAIRLAKAQAEQINDEFPEDRVHWRDLLSLPTAEGIQGSLSVIGQQASEVDE